MKNYRLLPILLFIFFTVIPSGISAAVVDTSLGREFKRIFPELSSDYIDLNGNGELDRLEDMDEKIPDSGVKDGIIQTQEILDYIRTNFRFISMDKLKAVKDALSGASGDIPELISLNYSSLMDEIISEKERLGANDLYLTPSAMRAAKDKMAGYIATMLNAYRKEERQYEDEFAEANKELFRMIEAGYPLPDLNSDDKELLTNLTIHSIIKDKDTDIEKVLAAIRTLGKLRAEEAIPYIRELLTSDKYGLESAIALGNIGSSESRQILMETLRTEEQGKLKNALIMALGKSGGDDSAGLILSLLEGATESGETETEKTIIASLAALTEKGIKNRQVYSVLTDYLSDENPEIRTLAIRGIAAYQTSASTALLLPMLKTEKSEDVRIELVKSLSTDTNPNTVNSFSALLQEPAISNDLKIVLLDSIGKNVNGSKAVIPVVDYLGSSDREVRDNAYKCLVNLYSQNGASVIGGISRGVNINNDELFLTEASSLLAELADPASIVTALALLGSGMPEVKKNATWALYRISPSDNVKVVDELQKLVTSETEPVEVRINSVRALGSIGYDSPRQEVWKTLLTTLKLKDPKYRMLKFYGIKAIGQMGTVNSETSRSLAEIAVRETDTILKLAAVETLRVLAPADESVERALVSSFNRSEDSSFRVAVIEALGDMGSAETPALASTILSGNPSGDLKIRVIYVLSHLGDEKSLGALLNIIDDRETSDYIAGVIEDADREMVLDLIQRRLKTESDPGKAAVMEDLVSRFETY